MPCCPNCHSPLPRQGRTTCLGCGRTFHWRSHRDGNTLIPMRGPDQDATLLTAFSSALLLAVRRETMAARATPR